MMDNIGEMINLTYDALEGFEDLAEYHQRHGTPSILILTQFNPEIAARTANLIKDDILGKTVIEIGAGVGYLSIEIARYAKSVVAFEIDPSWSWIFTKALYRHKPTNLTWIFGDARNFIGKIHADVSIVLTHSGIREMKKIANQMADKTIMPFQDK
jgi:tRNA G37 N-methylase Trm5